MSDLPIDFRHSACALLGEAEARLLCDAIATESPVSIRLNPWKTTADDANGLQRVPWCAQGRYLPTRPSFTRDPLFHAGCYYVQEASSMFLEQAIRSVIDANRPIVALDLCAAPGGKSTHLRTLLPEGSLLVANEVVPTRAAVLAENLLKWGHPDVVVTHAEPRDMGRLRAMFDLIVVDAPCSGEGMFRKEPVAVADWSLQTVAMCAERQRHILSDIWPALRPGGIMVYSTCTYNRSENDECVDYICNTLGAEPLSIDLISLPFTADRLSIRDSHWPIYRFLPHRVVGEGFTLAVVRKNCIDTEADFSDENGENIRRKGRKCQEKAKKLSIENTPSLQTWLDDPTGDYVLLPQANGEIIAMARRHLPMLTALSGIHILSAGTGVAAMRGKDYVPLHALSMSRLLRRDAFEAVELDYAAAIAYLRGEVVALNDAVPRGIVLMTYRGTALGFAKNVGRRANNLYPSAYRIRSTYMAAEPTEVLRRI